MKRSPKLNKLESMVIGELRRRKIKGYRLQYRKLPGSPDVAFTKRRVAVFIHGCFWHGCTRCTRNLTPKANSEFWTKKRDDNRRRDEKVASALAELGFKVVVVWECEATDDIVAVGDRITQALESTQP